MERHRRLPRHGSPDPEALQGFELQQIVFNGAGGPEVSATRNEPWTRGPTATRTRNGVTTNARMMKTASTRTRTALANGGSRTHKTATAYNTDGFPVRRQGAGRESRSLDRRHGCYQPESSNAKSDANGRVTEVTDARGYTTKTAYVTANGGLVTQTVVTNPLGQVVTTSKEPAWEDKDTKIVDQNGVVTELTYDGLGRLTAARLPDSRIWSAVLVQT